MEFWKNHVKLRMILIAVFFVAGIAVVIAGWRMTGKLEGLGLMILGVISLLAALFLYNKPFQRTRKK